ncbi:hypothetical protein BJX70DRAFT_410086 [Aspergillus crustosus]
MPPPKLPCTNCRRDEQKPKCGRCDKRKLDCVPVERKAVFRQGAKGVRDDCFAGDQVWVSSRPTKWRRTEAETGIGTGIGTGIEVEGESQEEELEVEIGIQRETGSPGDGGNSSTSGSSAAPVVDRVDGATGDDAAGCNSGTFFATVLTNPGVRGRPLSTAATSAPVGYPHAISPFDTSLSAAGNQASPASVETLGPSYRSPFHDTHISPSAINYAEDAEFKPLASVEESCLLRYFIEELSPWFDHCDDRSHFRLVVPLRAQYSLTLRNAIFAVSSRHLSRIPQYKSPQGIVYHGQTLHTLTHSSAVEYMLTCIPGLLSFPTTQDPQEQENLMAAAIILRQYEEMEEEMDESAQDPRVQRVNFLAITQKIIEQMISAPLGRSSLASAAYWIAIRQEVYYALTRRRVPSVSFTSEDWGSATPANAMIMHAGEVTEWCWGTRSDDEYERLRTHQNQLISDYSAHFIPILQKPADTTKGEIFPTVWYATDAQVTGVQHLELARMILTAENPRLQNPSTPRTIHRKAESAVRAIVLNLCGIAIDNNPRRMPALVNAVISIMLYGEYFTETRERNALSEVIERTKDMHAWPLRKPYERLLGLWAVGDEVEHLPPVLKKYTSLRLTSLQTNPEAFTSTHAREIQFTEEVWKTRLLNPLAGIFTAVGNGNDDSGWEKFSTNTWLGQVSLLGPVLLPPGNREAEDVPWELFKDLDFSQAAKAVIPAGSKVAYVLDGMYVVPLARGRGVGKGLVGAAVRAVERDSKERGVSATIAVLVLEGNGRAKRVSERAGFVARDGTVDIEGEKAWALFLDIGDT